jgi:GntR family transcriptional regulator
VKPGVLSDDWLTDAPDLGLPSTVPAHTRIEHWLTQVIGAGDLTPGDRLPREQDFAASLGVSRMTLRQALSSLENRGTVRRITGRTGGTFIDEPRIDCDLTGLAGFTEQMRRAHVRAGAQVISAKTTPSDRSISAGLDIECGASVHEIIRVRTANRKPLALERSYYPADAFPDLLSHRLTGSIYTILARHYGQLPRTAIETLEPVSATSEEAELLSVAENTPLMLIERSAYTAAGLAVEFARDLFRPDRVRISLRSGVDAPGQSHMIPLADPSESGVK